MTDRRLIEDSLPLAEISEYSAKEKSIRHGHISTLHLWWARRPLAAARAATMAALLPAPRNEDERQTVSSSDHGQFGLGCRTRSGRPSTRAWRGHGAPPRLPTLANSRPVCGGRSLAVGSRTAWGDGCCHRPEPCGPPDSARNGPISPAIRASQVRRISVRPIDWSFTIALGD